MFKIRLEDKVNLLVPNDNMVYTGEVEQANAVGVLLRTLAIRKC